MSVESTSRIVSFQHQHAFVTMLREQDSGGEPADA